VKNPLLEMRGRNAAREKTSQKTYETPAELRARLKEQREQGQQKPKNSPWFGLGD
jgi:hypothetical protein